MAEQELFEKALRFVLEREGVRFSNGLPTKTGYVNDPDDPGGETNFGISKRKYPLLDIANLTLDKASEIYYNDYWVRLHSSEIFNKYKFNKLAVCHFDASVNCNEKKVISWYVQACWFAEQHLPESQIIENYNQARIDFYKALNKPKFEKGWLNRVYQLEEFIKTL